MTKSDDNQLKAKSTSKKSSNKKLPWWVELLFVQIGLPEKLLHIFLKLNSKTRCHLESNNRFYLILFSIIAAVIYTNPLIISQRNSNNCISKVKGMIQSGSAYGRIKENISPIIIAVNYCNGGDGLEF